MNRTPSSHPSPPVGEKVPGGRLRGIRNGSWCLFAFKSWRLSLPMHRKGASRRARAEATHPTLDAGENYLDALSPAKSSWCGCSARQIGAISPRIN